MKKIPTLFVRDDYTHRITPVISPGCEWVAEGLGVATRKFDGTCCLVRDGKLYKRYEVTYYRNNDQGDWVPKKPVPFAFELATELDPETGKQQGWLPVGDGPEDRWHREAWSNQAAYIHHMDHTTWELCGPKVQGNPEKVYAEAEAGPGMHILIPHGKYILADCPRNFDSLKVYLATQNIEGVVWWHPDGHMAKVKGRDYGISRPRK